MASSRVFGQGVLVPKFFVALCLLAALMTTACGVSRPGDEGKPTTIRVPSDAATISEAVAMAMPGDLVLVSPGVYRETVQVRVPNLVIRGTDRNTVAIDGEYRRSNGIVVTAPGVVVENLTVRANIINGILLTGMSDGADGIAKGSNGYRRLDPAAFPPLQGFRVSYVTASNNGLYGIYAFDAQNGVIEQSYASGSADSGIYVGQCKPCRILVRDNVAERNAVGYEGTNASGEMYVVRNRFSGNRVGLTNNSDYQEAFVPQNSAAVVGNVVTGNQEPATPAQADGGFGIGIGIAGGTGNLVQRNRVERNVTAGVVLAAAEDLPPLDNRIMDNVLNGNGIDAVLLGSSRARAAGNCFSGNTLASTLPVELSGATGCSPSSVQTGGSLPVTSVPRGLPFPQVAAAPAQPGMPDATSAPAVAAIGLPGKVQPESFGLPEAGLFADRSALR